MPNALMPDTSSYSSPTVNALLAAGGTGSNAMDTSTSNALQVANQAQQLQSGKVTIDQQTYNLAKAKMDSLHQVYQSIVDNPDPDNVTWQIGQGVKAGIIDPQQGTDAATKFASFGNDRKQIQQFALNGMNINQSHQEALEQAFGAPGLANTGSSLVSTMSRTGPNGGVTQSGGPPIPVTLSPDQKTKGVTTVNPDGSSTFRPIGTLYDDKGNFVGTGGAGGTPSIPVYRGGGGGGAGAAPPQAGGGAGQGGQPPAVPPAAPQGSAPAGQGAGGQGTGGTVKVGYPASSGADSGTQSSVPVGQLGQGGAAPSTGQGGAPGAGAQGAMMTPNAQSLPVISDDMARAALKAYQNGQTTAANRNILRGYAVQNNLTQQLQHMGPFEPQPAGVGAGVAVPPQPAAGQGSAAAGQAATAQPQGQQPAAGQGSFGSRFGGQPGPSAGLTVGLSPGQEASLKASSDGYSSLASDVSNPSGVNQRLFQLRTALGALRNTQTGLGTAQRQQLVGYLASLPGGLAKWAPGVDPDSASAYDIATKYLTAYSLNTPGAARSDAGLSTAQSANANTSGMMQKAAQDVTLSNIGLENGKRALLNSFNASGADPGTFGKFASQWMQGSDPRAFALPDMTPAERGQLYASLQGPAKAAFLATVKKGIAARILTPNDLQGAAGNGQ